MPLLWVLRDVLGMTGTKFGCGIAQCGACTVDLSGEPTRSCLLPVSAIGSQPVTSRHGACRLAIDAVGQDAFRLTVSGRRALALCLSEQLYQPDFSGQADVAPGTGEAGMPTFVGMTNASPGGSRLSPVGMIFITEPTSRLRLHRPEMTYVARGNSC